jgi:hypothetical protein
VPNNILQFQAFDVCAGDGSGISQLNRNLVPEFCVNLLEG